MVLILVINLNFTLLLFTGLYGIPLDPAFILLAIGGIILSVLLIVAGLIPILTMPLACPMALGIMTLVQLYSIPFTLDFTLSYISTFLYFVAVAVGVVGLFLSLYLLFRNYLIGPLFRRYRELSKSAKT